jgi:hypothetical protein
MKDLSNEQLCNLLRQWGKEFKEQSGETGVKYYKICLDAYLILDGKALKFHRDIGSLKKSLLGLANEIERAIYGKHIHASMSERVSAFRHISERILQQNGVQIPLFN